MAIDYGRWTAARGALRATADRFTELVRSAPTPAAKATADWSVADTTAHVASIAALYAFLVAPDRTPYPFPWDERQFADTTVDTVAELNARILRQLAERDTTVLTSRLCTDIDSMLAATAQRDPTQVVPWLGDSRVPLAGLAAHLLNELLVHGRDIAHAIPDRRSQWTIPAQDIALFFDLFLVEVTRCGYGRLLDGGDRPRPRRVAVELRSRYTSPVTFVLHNGRVSVEEPGPDSDVRLWFDPAGLSLMLFGRISKARAALTGKVVIRGRRPWLLPRFLRTMRLPS